MSFRLLLVHLSVLGLSIGGLIEPRIGLLGYIWYALARPDALSWSEGMQFHSLILGVVTLAGTWRYVPNIWKWIQNPWVLSLIALNVTFLASVVAARWTELAWTPYLVFLKSTLLAFAIPLLVDTLRQLRYLFWTIALSIGLIGTKFGLFGVLAGGIYLEAGLGGHINDNNVLCAALVMGLPFLWFTAQSGGTVLKLSAYGATFTTLAAIVMTHSRGGFLSLVAVLGVLVLKSRYKITAIVLVAVMLIPVLWITSDTIFDRLSTIREYEKDSSASARLTYWKAAIQIFAENPVLGVGFGTLNWVYLSPSFIGRENQQGHVVHNNYLQMAVDSGAFAIAILLWQIYFSIFWLGRSARKLRHTNPELALYPQTLQAALVGFAVSSTFLSRTDYDFYYFLIMAVAAWWSVQRYELQAEPLDSGAPQLEAARHVHSPSGTLAQRRVGPAPRDRTSPLRRTPSGPSQ